MAHQSRSNQTDDFHVIGAVTFVSLLLGLLLHNPYALWTAAALLFCGLFLKRVSHFLAVNWLRLASLLGGINSWILLTLVYYLCLTPIAFIYRRFHGDHLKIGKPDDAVTLWETRNKTFSAADFDKMW